VAKPTTAQRTSAKAAAAEAEAPTKPTKPPKRQSTRDLDKTGNVRLLSGEADSTVLDAAAPEAAVAAEPPGAAAQPADVAAEAAAAAAEPTGAAAQPTDVAEPAAAAAPETAAPEPASAADTVSVAEPAAADAPLANYDELSVASLRARLRNLDVAQVRQLAEYERAHAARADVLIMFERRIAKLEAGA
jgi:hypothetical protein